MKTNYQYINLNTFIRYHTKSTLVMIVNTKKAVNLIKKSVVYERMNCLGSK